MLKLFETWPYYLFLYRISFIVHFIRLYMLFMSILVHCPLHYIRLCTLFVLVRSCTLSFLVHYIRLYTLFVLVRSCTLSLYNISVYAHCLFLSVLVHPFLYTISVYAHCMFLSVIDIVLTCTFYVFEPYSVSDALYINLFYLYLQSI